MKFSQLSRHSYKTRIACESFLDSMSIIRSIPLRGALEDAHESRNGNISSFDYMPSMYYDPPHRIVTTDQFESFAFRRLEVLRLISNYEAEPGALTQAEFQHQLRTRCRDLGLNEPLADTYSHFTLRLAFCKSEEWRRWFSRMETFLFRCRFELALPDLKSRFLQQNNFNLEEVSATEKRQLKESLLGLCGNIDSELIYKVPFSQALDLISRRSVFISRGFAYVRFRDIVAIVIAKFRAHLSNQLTATSRSSGFINIKSDGRVHPLLETLRSNQIQDRSYKLSTFSGSVKLDDIDALSKQSFPLCMQHLHQRLKVDRHLKNLGRQQLGLFLKGIGLSLEDSLRYWRESFSPRTPGDKFDKEYAYHIRFNYGKEGRRVEYTPYGCQKIISGPAPTGSDHHGCPFKHFDAENLRQKLYSMRLPNNPEISVESIVQLAEAKHYQVACKKYFALTHPNAMPKEIGIHPNAFFDESRKYHSEGSKSASGDETSISVKAE